MASMNEQLIIDGGNVPASDGATFDVFDPSSGDVLATVSKATKADVDRAVQAAQAAFEGKAWGGMAPAERGRIMQRIAHTLRDRAEELATLESRDNGKPLKQARTDVQVAARYFEFFAGIADKIMGHTIPLGPGFLDFTVREPIGVSAQIVPWNYPIQIGARGVAPALAAGCTVVLKPSSEAPMTALRLGEIGLACGLPAGVLNVVPVVMELGGKSPNVVFADADLDLTVQGVANAIFQNAGQTCSAGSRLLVERKAHGALVDRLAARARSMRVGPGVSDPDMGPIISKRQLETIERYVGVGTSEGAHVAAGGARPTDPSLKHGFYFQPTLLDGVGPDMRVAREEIFGPVLAIIDFDELEEAAALANRSDYGLVAGIWTRDINKAMSLASRIKSGQVYINTYGAGGGVELPFGGYKKSGYGREKGLESLASYTQVKNVCIKYA